MKSLNLIVFGLQIYDNATQVAVSLKAFVKLTEAFQSCFYPILQIESLLRTEEPSLLVKLRKLCLNMQFYADELLFNEEMQTFLGSLDLLC